MKCIYRILILLIVPIFHSGGCERSTEPTTPLVFEIESITTNAVEIRYGVDHVTVSGDTATTKDPRFLDELRQVIVRAHKVQLDNPKGIDRNGVRQPEPAIGTTWKLVIYDQSGKGREIKTVGDRWFYKDRALNNWVEMKNPEFDTFRNSLTTGKKGAEPATDGNADSQNQQ